MPYIDESTYQMYAITKFRGVNENPDGDTKMSDGELSVMRNFRITANGHLQVRPGTKTMVSLLDAWNEVADEDNDTTPTVDGVWRGFVDNAEMTVVAFGGYIFHVDEVTWAITNIGQATSAPTHFFGFNEQVFMLNGHEYMSWDGDLTSSFAEVVGYVPYTVVACTPAGEGTLLENVNRLNGYRRQRFSPDGSSKVFYLSEQNIDSIVSVESESTLSGYNYSLTNGTVTFSTAPSESIDSLTITYKNGDGAREEVEAMTHYEFFNGTTDTRVFLYGDETNRAIYSGIDNTAIARADYFPDLYEVDVGDENTNITSLIRHYDNLLAFKKGSTYILDYSTITLDDGSMIPAFTVSPVNRSIGNDALGQVKLLENNPLTMDSFGIYSWSSSDTSTASSLERTATRISDRVISTLKGFDFTNTVAFNRQAEREHWFLYDGTAVILNYATNTWYVYQQMDFAQLVEIGLELYGYRHDGSIVHIARDHRNDDGVAIDAYAATGALDFEQPYSLKYSPMFFVSIQPETNANVTVSVETDYRNDYSKKEISTGVFGFTHVNFADFSFSTNRKPKVHRVKIKVKKAVFYKLIFTSNSTSSTATILEVNIPVNYGSKSKRWV